MGTSKTFLAGCIANALLEQKILMLMTRFPKILYVLGGLYSAERNEYLASLNRYTMLVIDDMGIEWESQYTLETVYTVIDERYKSGKPFIITTNIQLDILGSSQDLEHARIYTVSWNTVCPYSSAVRITVLNWGRATRNRQKRY